MERRGHAGLRARVRDIDRALDELRVIGTPQETRRRSHDGDDHDHEWGLIGVAGRSLARLFAWGAQDAVLYRLTQWLDPRGKRSLQLLAQQAVVILARLRVSAVAEAANLRPDMPEVGTGRPGRSAAPACGRRRRPAAVNAGGGAAALNTARVRSIVDRGRDPALDTRCLRR